MALSEYMGVVVSAVAGGCAVLRFRDPLSHFVGMKPGSAALAIVRFRGVSRRFGLRRLRSGNGCPVTRQEQQRLQ